jgi:D-alanine-D-alanine ligase
LSSWFKSCFFTPIINLMKPRIALVTGGYSGEAVISYKSARTIQNNIDRDKFDVYWIDLRTDGWFLVDDDGNEFPVNRDDFSVSMDGSKLEFDAAFIGMHGTPGEDGKLQGYFDMIRMPYTSCDAATSALTFNKRYTVAVAAFGGIHVARSVHLFRDLPVDVDAILDQLRLPVFVKPNNGGSSIGMSKVNEAGQLEEAIAKAFKEDSQVLIEEMISGREFTIGVFEDHGTIRPLPMTEVITHNEFFDYQAKYEGKSKEVTPAEVEESTAEKIREAAVKIYRIFNCRGVVRIDFIFQAEEGKPYMLEINTIPGQSEASIVPMQVRAMGWELKRFYGALLDAALSRRSKP